jgi:hypothetical protein
MTDQDKLETFTVALMANGDRHTPWTMDPWSGSVIAYDGSIVYSTGRVDSRDEAWELVRGFLLGWRVAGYPVGAETRRV